MTAFNNASTFRVRSALQLESLRRAWEGVVSRHRTLRTSVVTGPDGFPQQLVHGDFEERRKGRRARRPPFTVHDVPGASDAQIADTLRRVHEEPYDLERQRCAQLHVLRRSPDDHVVMIRTHHLFDDHGSWDAIHGDLLDAYEADVKGLPVTFPPLEHGFHDFVADENAFIGSPEFKSSLEFWEERLAGLTSELELPTDRRDQGVGRQGATLTTRLEGAEELRAFCKTHGAFPYRVLLASYVALLHRYSGKTDIAIGTPVDCRGRKYAGVAGCFVNMLPFRFRVERGMTFSELLRHVDTVVRETLPHRFVPFPTLVERFWTRGSAGAPFFRSSFGFFGRPRRVPSLNRPEMSTHLPWRAQERGLDLCEPPPLRQQEGMFDLALWTWDLGAEGLALEVKYDPGLFTPEAAQRIALHYESLLRAVFARPDDPISRPTLLTETEVAQLGSALSSAPTTTTFEPGHAAFERRAAARPDLIAMQRGARHWTYSDTDRWANALAATLEERGVRGGDRIAVLLPKSPEAVAAFLGVLKCGAAFVPVDPAYPPERIRYMLGDATPRFVVTDKKHAHLAGDASPLVHVTEIELGRIPSIVAVRPDSLAYIIYTSGSTGRPKGVMVPHAGIQNLAQTLVLDWSLGPTDRVFAFAPFSFDACIAEIFPTFMAGGTLHLGGDPWPTGGKPLVDFMERERITHVTLPPSVWLSMPEAALPNLRVAISAGEPCPQEVVARWGNRRVFFNNYGPTETTVCATRKQCSPHEYPTIGRPIPGVIARILDEACQQVPIGVLGELYVGGQSLALGYFHKPELTQASFINDPHDGMRLYRTGDMVRLLATGDLDYIGRRDEQVKIRGFRVELSEVEAAIRSLPGVTDAAAVVRTIGAGRALAAYVVGDSSLLQSRLAERLPAHMIPQFVVSVESIPRSPSGKIDRSRLPEPVFGVAAREEPADDAERFIAGVWTTTLGHDDFRMTDNFFVVGGDSLSALQVLHRVGARFGRNLKPDILLRHGTIRALANVVHIQTLPPPATCVLELVDGQGDLPLVLVHPAGGELIAYRTLISHIRGRRILGIRSPATFELDAEELSIESLAARYVNELGALNLGPVDIVGWSLGGVIAQAMARRLPGQVRRLFLLDSSPRIPEHAALSDDASARSIVMHSHVQLYREHSPSAAVVDTFACWARRGGNAPGSWNELCTVKEEMTLEATHEELLQPPHVNQLLKWLT